MISRSPAAFKATHASFSTPCSFTILSCCHRPSPPDTAVAAVCVAAVCFCSYNLDFTTDPNRWYTIGQINAEDQKNRLGACGCLHLLGPHGGGGEEGGWRSHVNTSTLGDTLQCFLVTAFQLSGVGLLVTYSYHQLLFLGLQPLLPTVTLAR